MSMRGEFTAKQPKSYPDGRTDIAFKDSADINKLLVKARKAGSLSHLQKYKGVYGDFSDFDFFAAQNALAKGQQIFEELPAEIRREFNQNPGEFFNYVNDPANADNLENLLPKLAEPGTQNIVPGTGRDSSLLPEQPNAAAGGASEPQASETPSSEGGSTPTSENAGEGN